MIQVGSHYIETEIENVIIELKRQLEINGIKRFYKIKDTQNNLMVCCPFHKNGQEHKPSMGIYKNDGTCHCFTCGWVGSLSELVSNCFGYDDWGRFGEKWLVKNFSAIEIEERKDIGLDFSRSRYRSRGNRDCSPNTVKYVGEEELDRYRYYHEYWGKRGITDEGIIELFDLGFDKDTNCITMPVRDKDGNCLFVARRSVQTKFFNYPEGVEKPLYGLYELSQYWKGEYNTDVLDEHGLLHDIREYAKPYISEVIVCESMIDALTCWQYGSFAVALNGLGNNLQFTQLKQLPCRTLVIATDNDEAGIKARQRIAKNINNKILKYFVFPKNKKDINDLSLEEFLSLEQNFL